jgi:hypothetical protein
METRVSSPATYIISGLFTLSAVCLVKFAAVNRDNVKDVVSAHTVLWAVIDVALYRSLTVIYFNNFSRFPLLIFLALKSLYKQNSQTFRPSIYRNYHRKMQKIKGFKLN